MKSAPFITILAALGTIGAVAPASAAWVRLPNQEVRSINLATEQIAQTGIESSKGIGQAANLIDEDPTKVATLSAGQASAVIRLNSQQYVDTITLSNAGAEGVVTVSGSADKSSWNALSQVSFTSSDVAVSARFASAQVRYVRLDFETSAPGAITNIAILGSAASAAAAGDNSSSNGKANLASAIGGARAIYASPAPTNLGDKETSVNILRFPQSNQPAKTLVYELSGTSLVDAISLSYDRSPTQVDVFAFDQLPEKKDWRGKLTLDPAFLDTATPVASGVDSRGLGRIKVKPSSSFSAQYIVIRLQAIAQGAAAVPASDFGFEGSQLIASTPPGGSTIGGLLINGAFSSVAFNQAVANALGGAATTPGTQPGSGNLDTAITPLIGYGAFSSDYRASSAVGLGNSGTSPTTPQVINNTVVRPVRGQPIGSGSSPNASESNP
ncbi:hypothetical protein FEM03_19420 [Phragmitibacter flavus]|uniref:Discoidin domain-containing protein n=1 Tax=Phragmitibacter flavus TaxID=2576071 RepID=A0A5R8K9Q3_9BACT|nr:hypothetical protein [Phragmitibacter flavus]TLD69040.1 hypothetical protein FEM03_19420 [Phragmitibacter flavus]